MQYLDPADAAEAQYHMDRRFISGREITVVFAEENRKKPAEMRTKERTRSETTSSHFLFYMYSIFVACSYILKRLLLISVRIVRGHTGLSAEGLQVMVCTPVICLKCTVFIGCEEFCSGNNLCHHVG